MHISTISSIINLPASLSTWTGDSVAAEGYPRISPEQPLNPVQDESAAFPMNHLERIGKIGVRDTLNVLWVLRRIGLELPWRDLTQAPLCRPRSARGGWLIGCWSFSGYGRIVAWERSRRRARECRTRMSSGRRCSALAIWSWGRSRR